MLLRGRDAARTTDRTAGAFDPGDLLAEFGGMDAMASLVLSDVLLLF